MAKVSHQWAPGPDDLGIWQEAGPVHWEWDKGDGQHYWAFSVRPQRGWGDVEFVATDHGVPTIYYGPGTVAAAHTADEYIELDRYHTGIAVYTRAIRQFLETA